MQIHSADRVLQIAGPSCLTPLRFQVFVGDSLKSDCNTCVYFSLSFLLNLKLSVTNSVGVLHMISWRRTVASDTPCPVTTASHCTYYYWQPAAAHLAGPGGSTRPVRDSSMFWSLEVDSSKLA